MQITWEGKDIIKIYGEKNNIIINPETKSSEFNVVLSPKYKEGFENNFVIENPGEYETNDDFFYVDFCKNKDGGNPLIFKLNVEDINIVNLNNIDHKLELSESENSTNYENIIDSKLDILILPIGEEFLDVKDAIAIKNELSPKIVIAINYNLDSEKDQKKFQEFRSAFTVVSDPQDKFKITKKNLSGGQDDETMLVILNKTK